MRLLVTRPEPDATALKERLAARGHEVLIEPLLKINLLPVDDIELEGTQALIATSRNAVRALAQGKALDVAQAIPIFAVGPATAAAAQALGFQEVIEGPKDAAALVALIALRAEVNAGPLVYLAGDVQAADLGGELRHLGFHVHEPVVYASAVADKLSPGTVRAIESGKLDGVLLLSPRTARTFARLILAHGLTRTASNLTYFCLSPAIARGLDALPEPRTRAAVRPTSEDLLALIDDAAPLSP